MLLLILESRLLARTEKKENMSVHRRVKSTEKKVSSQDKRREQALRRQKEARRDLHSRARDLVLGGAGGDNSGDGDDGSEASESGHSLPSSFGVKPAAFSNSKKSQRENRVRERRRYWASQVQTPEWMTDVPAALNGAGQAGIGWFVRPRPEGRRCLVMSHNGVTVSRQ